MTYEPKAVVTAQTTAFLGRPHHLFVGGAYHPASEGTRFKTLDPASGMVIAEVDEATAADVDFAVTVAQEALEGPWSRLPPSERERLLHRLADLIDENSQFIAEIESLDSGKPVEHIKFVDIPLSSGALRYNAGWATKILGDVVPVNAPDMHVYTRKEPIGVVGAIVPWNFPLCQAAFKVAPALAAGCTVILKPAEATPLSALILGELAIQAGIPPGVLNVLPGHGHVTGEALIQHPGVAKISFTGSEAVGKHIARVGSATLKHVSLELGGKNPQIILEDADLDAAAATAAIAGFFYSGQVCTAGSRVMVQRSVLDRILPKLEEAAKAQVLGHGLAQTSTMGPLISGSQRQRVAAFVTEAQASGAQVLFGSDLPQDSGDGYFYRPTVVVENNDQARVVREEIFGPVIIVQVFDTIDEVIQRANETPYGLAAGIWTRDSAKVHHLASRIKAGTVWVNTYNQFDAAAPFGGYKQSGYGRDHGREGIEKFLETKTVWVNTAM